MGLTDANIGADMDAIFSDLSDCGCNETFIRIPAGGTSTDVSFEAIRGKQKSSEELMATGFAKEYRFTILAQVADMGDTTEGDKLRGEDAEEYRVFRVTPQPSKNMAAIDLGSDNEDGGGY